MTPEQINIAIAEACGWKMFYQKATDDNWGSKDRWITAPDGTSQFRHNIPNYYGDLNAMHEAEEYLHDWVAYRINLSKIVGIGYTPDLDVCDDIKSFVSATAAQRSEAFLRTIGKWVE